MEKDTKPKDVEVKSNVEGLELYSDNYPFRLSLRVRNFENEAEYKKFIKNCEMNIRRSIEYKLWRNYIVDILHINSCVITGEVMGEVSIDVHHHLPGLYMFTSAIINKKIEKEEEFCSFDICQEVIQLHFMNKVGYTTLLKSMHEKFHNGFLTIPIESIKGDYNYFLENYSKYLDEDDLEVIEKRLGTNESNCTWSRDDYAVG